MSEWIKRLAERFAEVNESKFLIPEEIPTQERTAFMGAAAAAHKAGKTSFEFGGKTHKVTMKKDTANAIADEKVPTNEVAQKQEKQVDEPEPTKEAVDLDKDNADKAIRHDCATHVKSESWGYGECISGQHTIVETAEGEGYVTHYDVMFEHGIEHNVPVEDLEILREMSHSHSKKKKENVEVEMNPKKEKKKDDKTTTDTDMAAEAKVDEISVGKLQRYAKGAVKDLEKNRATVRTALEPGASQKKAEKGMKAMKTISKRSRGSDMYTDKMTGRSKVKPTAEETEAWPVYKRIMEKANGDRAKHYGKAADPEDWNEKEKNNKGAMDMKKDMKADAPDEAPYKEKDGHDDASKAGRVGPNAKTRSGDNKKGDKKVINPVAGVVTKEK